MFPQSGSIKKKSPSVHYNILHATWKEWGLRKEEIGRKQRKLNQKTTRPELSAILVPS